MTRRRAVDVHRTDRGPVVSTSIPNTDQVSRSAIPLTDLERIQDDFITSVSHELRTPLTSILGYSSLLLDGAVDDLTPLQHRMIQRVESNSQRLLSLVDNLLTLSGIQSGTFCMVRANVDLADVVADSLTRSADALAAGMLDLTVDLGVEPCIVLGDETQLGRVVTCLVDNAVTFSRPGGQIQVVLRPDGDDLVLEVADTGVGIAPNHQEHLFDRFVRSPDSSAREVQGLGLGLAVVRSIVSSHGGSVSLRSAPGVGTAVTVRLPRASGETSSVAS